MKSAEKMENFLQKCKYLRKCKSVLDKIKSIFHSFWKAIIWWKNKKIDYTSFKYWKYYWESNHPFHSIWHVWRQTEKGSNTQSTEDPKGYCKQCTVQDKSTICSSLRPRQWRKLLMYWILSWCQPYWRLYHRWSSAIVFD